MRGMPRFGTVLTAVVLGATLSGSVAFASEERPGIWPDLAYILEDKGRIESAITDDMDFRARLYLDSEEAYVRSLYERPELSTGNRAVRTQTTCGDSGGSVYAYIGGNAYANGVYGGGGPHDTCPVSGDTFDYSFYSKWRNIPSAWDVVLSTAPPESDPCPPICILDDPQDDT